jgi:hypothetical protein
MTSSRIKNTRPHIGNQPLILDQSRLNIEARSRRSRLPWRGQFSPELVDYLIDTVCPESQSFLDPFCGSGTVLFEAVEKGRSAYGLEVNPAAWHLASLASFAALSSVEKAHIIKHLKAITSASSSTNNDLFSVGTNRISLLDAISAESHPFLKLALAAAMLLGMGDRGEMSAEAIARGAFAVTALLNNMDGSTSPANCLLADARNMPLETGSVEAVITSPPYINVFNYHQNYRSPVELLGWLPLQAARSEIGSNRKHRMNRFLTVIQYSLDMALCLSETTRVLKDGCPLIIILGRTSNVLGASFANGAIIESLMMLGGGVGPIQKAERVFTNRFGERIYEDILITTRTGIAKAIPDEARAVGVEALQKARTTIVDKNKSVLEAAIANAANVAPSPHLALLTPTDFQNSQTSSVRIHAGY